MLIKCLSYEKVAPTTPTASSYAIVGYATTYRYWLYKKDGSQDPDFKNASFPLPEIKISELPARLRIAQFMILPSHHRAGHGNNLYTTIHAACIADPTIMELTVEDPNEQFDALRDTADFCLLRPEFLKHHININPDPNGMYSESKSSSTKLTEHLIPQKVLSDIRTEFKIETTQFAHVLEMFLLNQIPKGHRGASANLARLLVKKHNAEDPNDRRYFWWRLLIKQRIYKKHKELLDELEILDRAHKLNETVLTVEEGYEIRLEALKGRFPVPSTRREKRKHAVLDDDDEEEAESGAELVKRPKN
ncbi:hypothetical protein N7495_000400 [Penicillium taxi]|uniref:uncharacterized protein n=1 Tax=Penicillium taxi TaxID=168475 RepID=UPI002545730D|nr:uncharacterized protein N7495_000400 [Penicillium taxi]KAJ5907718.1 hypothetical protein N7495_000400 [Penicillium taxi]